MSPLYFERLFVFVMCPSSAGGPVKLCDFRKIRRIEICETCAGISRGRKSRNQIQETTKGTRGRRKLLCGRFPVTLFNSFPSWEATGGETGGREDTETPDLKKGPRDSAPGKFSPRGKRIRQRFATWKTYSTEVALAEFQQGPPNSETSLRPFPRHAV